MTQHAEERILTDRRQRAVHEAGHAVIGRVLTLTCGGATIEADADAAGHSITADPHTCADEWRKRGRVRFIEAAVWHGRIIAFMAGLEAELIVLGSARGGDGDDRRQIQLMIEEVEPDPAKWGRLVARLRAMTRMLVRRHRNRIERVADVLLAKRRLTARQLDKLVGRSVDDVAVNAPFLLIMRRRPIKRGIENG